MERHHKVPEMVLEMLNEKSGPEKLKGSFACFQWRENADWAQ